MSEVGTAHQVEIHCIWYDWFIVILYNIHGPKQNVEHSINENLKCVLVKYVLIQIPMLFGGMAWRQEGNLSLPD